MALTKVISGGQTGVDIAALRAAKARGIRTGGTAPKAFMTLAGSNPDLRDVYHLEQVDTDSYAYRTMCNVRDSDGTLRLARNFDTYGEQCTLKYIRKFDKPTIDVWLLPTGASKQSYSYNPDAVHDVLVWLYYWDIKILNVAGSSSPKVESTVEEFLTELFKREKMA